MNILKLLAITLLCLTFSTAADAKWWIFGQSENEISTRYLYLNGVSYDELGDKVTVYRETLPEGQLVLRGKAGTTSSQVAVVQVSRDGKATWKEAKRSDDGTFEYGFKPEIGKSYLMYVKIMDTTGKSNDVEATRKEVTVSDQNISVLVRKALDDLIAAYRAEDPRGFMNLVSPDFAADSAILDRAIRKDFTAFDNIDLRYTLNNVTSAGSGKVFVSLSFTRGVTSSRSGKTLTDKASTEFVFSMEDKGAKVFSMKNPLIFGLSDAENVATGTVPSSEPTIRISDNEIILSDLPYGEDGATGTAPTNLAVESLSYPELTLTFDAPASVTSSDYKRVLQWSTSRIGPWNDDTDPIFSEVSLTTFTVHCRGEIWDAGTIYYRLALEKISSRERSNWSNVVSVGATP
jgi:hypothetical protein